MSANTLLLYSNSALIVRFFLTIIALAMASLISLFGQNIPINKGDRSLRSELTIPISMQQLTDSAKLKLLEEPSLLTARLNLDDSLLINFNTSIEMAQLDTLDDLDALDALSNYYESIWDQSEVQFNLDYDRFKEKSMPNGFRKISLKRDFIRAFFWLHEYEEELLDLQDQERVELPLSMIGDAPSPAVARELALQTDASLYTQEKTAAEMINLAAFYYANSRRYKTLYFPPFDYQKPFPKSTLTQLYFQDRLSKVQFNTLSSSLLNVTFDKQASLSADLLSTYFGPGKLLLSTLVATNSTEEDSTTTDAKTRDAFERLIGGGGNLGLSYEIPIFEFVAGKSLTIGAIWTPRISTDIPELGTSTDTVLFQYEPLSVQNFAILTPEGPIDFFASFKFSRVFGNNTYQDLTGRTSFNYSQFSIGLTVNDAVRIAYNIYNGLSSAEGRQTLNSLSVVLITN